MATPDEIRYLKAELRQLDEDKKHAVEVLETLSDQFRTIEAATSPRLPPKSKARQVKGLTSPWAGTQDPGLQTRPA